jgi:hypothetical protein
VQCRARFKKQTKMDIFTITNPYNLKEVRVDVGLRSKKWVAGKNAQKRKKLRAAAKSAKKARRKQRC